MARLAPVVAVDVPHHVTQRGNARQFMLASDSERMVYLDLLRQAVQLHPLSVIGYCLMSNHVHLVVVPHKAEALASALKQAHGQYASYWNASHACSGHVWQGRYYSCPLDQAHLWEALRYAELNPVRAGMVAEPETWPWSSAAAHCGTAAGCLSGDGYVASTLVGFQLAKFPGRRGNGIRPCCSSTVHAYRTSARNTGIHQNPGARDEAATGAAEGWASGQADSRWKAAKPWLRQLKFNCCGLLGLV